MVLRKQPVFRNPLVFLLHENLFWHLDVAIRVLPLLHPTLKAYFQKLAMLNMFVSSGEFKEL